MSLIPHKGRESITKKNPAIMNKSSAYVQLYRGCKILYFQDKLFVILPEIRVEVSGTRKEVPPAGFLTPSPIGNCRASPELKKNLLCKNVSPCKYQYSCFLFMTKDTKEIGLGINLLNGQKHNYPPILNKNV